MNNIQPKPDSANKGGVEPCIFIVTSVYNGGERLKTTLQSVLAQTSSNFIHYIYDDGSLKPSDEEVQEYLQLVKARKDPYPVIYEKGRVNIGVDEAHAHCFRKCTGTHLMWLDAGDKIRPNFIAEATKQISRHPRCTWFHVNSIHFTLDGHYYPKSNATQFHLRNLKRSDQKPFVYSGVDFFYHHFVIDYQTLLKLNPKIVIENGKKSGGLFYDAQIATEFAASNQPMFFIQKPLSEILFDPKSIACSTPYDTNMMKQTACNLLKQLNFPDEAITFYQEFSDFNGKSLSIKNNALTGQKQKAKDTWNQLVTFMKENHLPSYYFIYKKRARFFYHCSKYPLLLWLYRKIKRG